MTKMIAQQIFLIILFCICTHFSDGCTKNNDCDCNYTYIIDYPECYYLQTKRCLICFNDLIDEWKKPNFVRILIFCKWSKETFDPQKILWGFTYLRELIIKDSNNLRRLSTFSNKTQYIKKICVTDTNLHTFPKDVFSNLPILESINLTNNAFEEINVTAFSAPTLKYIFLAGNPLRCTKDTAWILDSSEGSVASKVVDTNDLLCITPYNYTISRPLVPLVEIIMTLEKECKRTGCDCKLIYVAYADTFAEKALNSVNCSYRGLTKMPSFLPVNTTTLYLTGNKIKDLTPLMTSTYKSILNLHLDDNLIESIAVLEGSEWLNHFRLLNLRSNKFTDLPIYILNNALRYNHDKADLYLGNNSWTCDCYFTSIFQNFLIKYKNIVKDINDIRCAFTSNNYISNKQISNLTRTKVCISNEDWLYPEILSIIFGSLIFLILGRFLYDYWSFQKTGKLPWISRILKR